MDLKSSVIICTILVGISLYITSVNGNCQIDGINFSWEFTYLYLGENILLDHNDIIVEYNMTNTISLRSVTNENAQHTYISATFDSETNKLTIFATNMLQNYDLYEINPYIIIVLALQCQAGNPSYSIRFNLEFVNRHDPQFSNGIYDFTLPLPLAANFDLTLLHEIYTDDFDIEGNEAVFSIDPEDLLVISRSRTEGKRSYASLILQRTIITMSDEMSFIITATDQGEPPRSSTATIILRADPEVIYTPDPTFESALYNGILDEAKEVSVSGITINMNSYTIDTTIELYGELSSLFNFTNNANDISVFTIDPLTEEVLDGRNFLVLTIVASRPNANDGSTVLIIDIPLPPVQEIIPIPVFTSSIFKGIINEDLTLTFENDSEQIITTETYSNEILFTLDGDDSALFTISNAPSNAISMVTILNALTEADIEDKTYFMLILNADVEDVGSSSAVIFIDITPKRPIPEFEKNLYFGVINETYHLDLENMTILLDTYDEEIEVTINGVHRELFELESLENEYTLKIIGSLGEDQLLGIPFFLLTITANLPGIGQSSTNVLINVTKIDTIPPPRFERPLYTGVLINNESIEIENIILNLETFNEFITFEILQDEVGLFNITQEENIIHISLTHELTDEELENLVYFTFTIAATNEDTGDVGHTVVIIDIPIPETPEPIPLPIFEKSFYIGFIDDAINASSTLTIEPIIMLAETYNEVITFELQGEDAIYFDVSNVDNTINLSFIYNEEDVEMLYNQKYLLFTLLAIREDVGNASVIIIVNLPEKEVETPSPIPTFEKTTYIGLIVASDDDYQLELETININLETFSDDLTLHLEGVDSELFTYDMNENVITISLIRELTDVDLENKCYFISELFVTHPVIGSSSTILLINLPEKICDPDAPCPTCPAVTECPPTVPCPECPTLPPEVDDNVPVFEHRQYTFLINTDMIGDFGMVLAKVNLPGNNIISYSINDDSLQQVISINQETGVLTVSERLPPDTYEFEVIATYVTDSTIGTTLVKLIVNGDYSRDISHSLLIKHLSEDTVHTENLPPHDIDCSYQLVEMLPNNRVYVSINSAANTLSTIRIDREDDIFSNMAVPQIQIKLRLVCGDEVIDVPVPDPENDLDTDTDPTEPVETETEIDIDNELPDNTNDDNDVNPDDNPVEEIPNETPDTEPENNTENNIIETASPVENEPDVNPSDTDDELQSPIDIESKYLDIELLNITKMRSIVKRNVKSVAYASIREVNPQIDDGTDRWFILTKDIPFSNNTLMINIVIDDINDNPPEFIGTPTIIGYPESNIIERLLVPYLLKVEATDKDFGINAQIRYSIQANIDFDINSESGIIMPKVGAMTNDNVLITVMATDSNGAAGGLTSSISINVRRLERRHLTVVTVENGQLNEVNQVMEYLQNQAQINIMLLQSAYVPNQYNGIKTASRNFLSNVLELVRQINGRQNDQSIILRLIIYAFDSSGNLINTDEVQEQLRRIDESYGVTALPFEEAFNYDASTNAAENHDDLIFIIIISVLGVLFIGTALIAFLMWWFLIRGYEFRNEAISDSNSSQINLGDADFKSESTPPSQAKLQNDKRESYNIKGGTTQESTDDQNRLNKSLGLVLDDDRQPYGSYSPKNEDRNFTNNHNNNVASNERRRSQTVTFNELVERIDIEETTRDSEDEMRM